MGLWWSEVQILSPRPNFTLSIRKLIGFVPAPLAGRSGRRLSRALLGAAPAGALKRVPWRRSRRHGQIFSPRPIHFRIFLRFFAPFGAPGGALWPEVDLRLSWRRPFGRAEARPVSVSRSILLLSLRAPPVGGDPMRSRRIGVSQHPAVCSPSAACWRRPNALPAHWRLAASCCLLSERRLLAATQCAPGALVPAPGSNPLAPTSSLRVFPGRLVCSVPLAAPERRRTEAIDRLRPYFDRLSMNGSYVRSCVPRIRTEPVPYSRACRLPPAACRLPPPAGRAASPSPFVLSPPSRSP